MKPYRSVSGGSVLSNLLAVASFAFPTLDDWKKDPRFCLERSTVGGLLSSGTIDVSSTEGRGVSSVGEVAGEPDTAVGGETAVVGNGRDDEIRWSNEGATGPSGLLPPIVAFETDESKLLPTARAWSP